MDEALYKITGISKEGLIFKVLNSLSYGEEKSFRTLFDFTLYEYFEKCASYKDMLNFLTVIIKRDFITKRILPSSNTKEIYKVNDIYYNAYFDENMFKITIKGLWFMHTSQYIALRQRLKKNKLA